MELDDGATKTNEWDFSTAAPAEAKTRGPQNKGFDYDLGLTTAELTQLAQDLVKNPPGKKPPTEEGQ